MGEWRAVKGSERVHYYEELNGLSLCGRFGSESFRGGGEPACFQCSKLLRKKLYE
jgi:hypothetical protein